MDYTKLGWKYESDGDEYIRTHYITAENPNGGWLKDTFFRIDVKSKKEGLELIRDIKSGLAIYDEGIVTKK